LSTLRKKKNKHSKGKEGLKSFVGVWKKKEGRRKWIYKKEKVAFFFFSFFFFFYTTPDQQHPSCFFGVLSASKTNPLLVLGVEFALAISIPTREKKKE
jgi:hypothetical protein